MHRRLTDALLEASKYGPSVFPILFATIVGRSAHAILLWRLEMGEQLGILDILAGSTSLTSTITSQLKLRIISILGLVLAVLWALSPVGGQASIRQMSVGDKITIQRSVFNYKIPKGTMQLDSNWLSNTNLAAAHFLAMILAPKTIKSSPLDIWGNIKIPLIEHYENTSEADHEGWFTVENDANDVETYSSLIGIPVSGFNTSGFIDYAMNIKTYYLRLSCPVVNASLPDLMPPVEVSNTTQFLSEDWPIGGTYIWWYDDLTQRISANVNDVEPFTFTHAIQGPTRRSECSITTTYVEVEIFCPTSSTCAVVRLRRSLLRYPPPAHTELDLGWEADEPPRSNWETFVKLFMHSAGYGITGTTPVDNYVVSPDQPGGFEYQSDPPPGLEYLYKPDPYYENVPDISNEIFAIRLGQLLNAYWSCLKDPQLVSGVHLPEALIDHNTTNGTCSVRTEVIVAHKGWVAILAIVPTVMIVASLVHPIVRFFLTQGPDLMLNISSLVTRNNPHIMLPPDGSFLGASDRARLLKNMKVRFGDVDSQADVGSLAIGSIDEGGEVKVHRVKKGRLFE